jgi:hypothetical protein
MTILAVSALPPSLPNSLYHGIKVGDRELRSQHDFCQKILSRVHLRTRKRVGIFFISVRTIVSDNRHDYFYGPDSVLNGADILFVRIHAV